LLVTALVVAIPTIGWAQQDGFDVQRFQPMPSQQMNYFNVASNRILPHFDLEVGLIANYASDVLILRNGDVTLVETVTEQMTGELLAAVGFGGTFELGIALPMVLMQGGEASDFVLTAEDAEFGLGDIRIVPRLQLYSTIDDDRLGGYAIGVMLAAFLPVGDEEAFQGEGGVRVDSRVVGDLAFTFFGRPGRVSLNLGYLARPEAVYQASTIDDALTYGIAASLPITDHTVTIVPELHGQRVLLGDDIALEESPVEALLGLKTYPADTFLIEAGAGLGLNQGLGNPAWRVFFGLSYSNRPGPPRDTDLDGYFDHEDGCPEEAEDFDGFEDQDGCLDPDNDDDTVLDADDRCPWDREDLDEWLDEDGCPDPDNDGDTVFDTDDECPLEAEDLDQFLDSDGCPAPDNDGDGFADAVDTCPMQREIVNNYEDDDGCPDDPPLILTACDRIELEDSVYFDTGSDVIKEESYGLIDAVASLLSSNEDILRIRIEGHTDSRGRARANRRLSQRRAESVVNALVERGIDAERLVPQGYGEDVAIDTNDTGEGRARNRRVELLILEQEGCDLIDPPY